MQFLKWKFNLFLVFITIVSIFVVMTVDSRELDSIVIANNDYDDSLVINEVNVSDDSSDDSSSKDSDNNVNNKTVFVNAVVNKWTFPVAGSYAITTYYSGSHQAIDIYSYSGYDSNILAANSGVVIDANSNCTNQGSSCNGRRGNYVIIKHNVSDYYTVYMHLNKIYVSVGDVVNSGAVIASMGNTGYVIPARTASQPYNGTHLHFCLFKGEPYRGGYAINPFSVY